MEWKCLVDKLSLVLILRGAPLFLASMEQKGETVNVLVDGPL
jgi:hypothetical protein